MGRTVGNICNSVIFGKNCKESFLPLKNNPRAKALVSSDISLSGLSTVGKGYRVSRFGHKINVLIFTTKGEGTAITDKGTLKLTPGTLLINPAGVKIEYLPRSKNWSFFWFHINPGVKWKKLFSNKENLLKFSASAPFLENAIRNFITESLSKERNAPLISEFYARLILLYLEREMNSDMDNTRLSIVWDTVNANLARKWTIEKLAKIVAMSPDYFAHASSKLYGLSPMKLVTKLRMERAKELLFTEEYKLETISSIVGYEDQFAFSTAFKRHEGLSPKSYKLKHGSGKQLLNQCKNLLRA